MNAGVYARTEVFAYDRQLTAPLFQRPCVWEKEEQWQPLWEDVQGIADALVRGKPDVKEAHTVAPDQQPPVAGHGRAPLPQLPDALRGPGRRR